MGKKKAKVPKRIAGFKIPKQIRRGYKPVLKLLAQPQVQAMLGAALAAGTAALAEQAKDQVPGTSTAQKIKKRLKFFAAEGQDPASELGRYLGHALGTALATYMPGSPHAGEQTAVKH